MDNDKILKGIQKGKNAHTVGKQRGPPGRLNRKKTKRQDTESRSTGNQNV